MNEKFDLVNILKNCPEGTELYSTIYGYVTFSLIEVNNGNYSIKIEHNSGYDWFTRDGRLNEAFDGECVLFPSKDQRDWSKFKLPNEDVDSDYSKKQEVKYRPFKNADECFEEMKKHEPFGWIRSKYSDYYTSVIKVGKYGVIYNHEDVGFDIVFNVIQFVDGSQFGINEE